MLAEICTFFRSGECAAVPTEETMEIYAFMCAADESKKRGGVPVSTKEVTEAARQSAQLIIDDAWYTPGMARARASYGQSLGSAPALASVEGKMLDRELRGFGRNSDMW
jgi:hypothetical protein